MHHLVQCNLSTEKEFDRMVDALNDVGAEFSIVKVIPFAHEILPDVNPPGHVMVWGAHTMSMVAKNKGWTPGAFINENFDMRILHEKYGDYMLNSDATFWEFGSIPKYEGNRFIRPVHDNKAFTGEVVNSQKLADWKEAVSAFGDEYATLKSDTPVLVASVKPLTCEARFFVVDGVVVTGSTYRNFGAQNRKRIGSDNPMGMPLKEFAQRMVNIWQPDRAFVIDIALMDGECKIIEINCINASGFYDCDRSAVIRAVDNMQF